MFIYSLNFSRYISFEQTVKKYLKFCTFRATPQIVRHVINRVCRTCYTVSVSNRQKVTLKDNTEYLFLKVIIWHQLRIKERATRTPARGANL
jgi:hypothetical protein